MFMLLYNISRDSCSLLTCGQKVAVLVYVVKRFKFHGISLPDVVKEVLDTAYGRRSFNVFFRSGIHFIFDVLR